MNKRLPPTRCRRNTWRMPWRPGGATSPTFLPYRAPAWTPMSRLTYDIQERRLELDIEGFTYPAELLPVNPFDAMPLRLARIAADMAQPPLPAAKDYENWLVQHRRLRRLDEQAIANMREGVRRGYTSPRPLMERMLPLLQSLGEDAAANVFYLPLRAMARGHASPRD